MEIISEKLKEDSLIEEDNEVQNLFYTIGDMCYNITEEFSKRNSSVLNHLEEIVKQCLSSNDWKIIAAGLLV